MAFHDFWTNVIRGAGGLPPQVTADAPKLDPEWLEQTLRAAPDWLTVKSVRGFDPADLAFLPEAERQRITDLVSQFHKVASTVRRLTKPTEDQINEALPLFRDLILSLSIDRYGDPDAFRIGKLIEQNIAPDRPDWISDLRFNTGEDAAGDPGLWIWVIVADEALQGQNLSANSTFARELFRDAAETVAPGVWPYMHFRTESEQREIEEEVASS